MGKVDLDISTSLDGYVAGPNPSFEEPLGEGGERLHEWSNLVPVLLAGGTRLLEGLSPDIPLERIRVIDTPGVTHLRYRVGR